MGYSISVIAGPHNHARAPKMKWDLGGSAFQLRCPNRPECRGEFERIDGTTQSDRILATLMAMRAIQPFRPPPESSPQSLGRSGTEGGALERTIATAPLDQLNQWTKVLHRAPQMKGPGTF